MSMLISKAIIPAAGRGTRMGALTRALPKEMLPLGNKPMIQWAVEEAASAGVAQVCIVIRKGKEIIKDHLQLCFAALRNAPALTFVYQRLRDGLGGALRAARRFVGPDLFLMIIPDQFLEPKSLPASCQLVSRYRFEKQSVLSSLVRIPARDLLYFPGSRPFSSPRRISSRGVFPIGFISKDGEEIGRRRLAVRGFGRTIFPPAIFDYLGNRFRNRRSGEIDLFRTFVEFPERIPHWGSLLTGQACDLGTLDGYRRYAPVFGVRGENDPSR